MDSPITVRLDDKLKQDAERVLEGLGLTTSTAVRLFLNQVVQQQGVPFEVPPELTVDMRIPPEIMTDIVIELLAVVTAEVWRMALAAESAEAREQIEQVHDALHELRFSFNPHDRDEVGAIMRKAESYAQALEDGADPRSFMPSSTSMRHAA